MNIDFFLTAITLVVAIIGTSLKDPSRNVKIFLIGLAVLASLGSVIKSANDKSDKEFMQTALISTLTPTNSSYQRLIDDVGEVMNGRGFNDARCNHSSDGMACFLSSADNKHGTLIFNKSDVAIMYANQIRRVSNKKVVDSVFEKSYTSDELYQEEFLDKAGVLGTSVFFDMFQRSVSEYNYDDRIGIQMTFNNDDGKRQVVGFSPSDIAQLKETKAPDLFYDLEQRFRAQYGSVPKPASP